MKKIALLALLALLIAPAARAADPATEARVQILKGQIEGFLENQKAMALRNGCKLDTKGSVAVEEGGGYYAFTLPHMTYTDSKGIRSELGMIAVNATPDAGNDWKITVALPTPISSFNASGAEVVRTDIGTQNATGVWNEKLGHFTSVNANLGNVQVNDLVKQSTVTVNGVTLNSNLTEKDPEAYTGTANAVLSNVAIYHADTNFKGTIPTIAFKTNLADRASKTPMTKEQVKNRPQNKYPDGFNIFAFLFGAPERVAGTITGLDAINAQLQQSMITASPNDRAKILQNILAVSAVSGMGKPVPNDPASKSYDIMFGADGNVTLNGTDLGALTNVQPAAGGAKAGTPVLR
jgi:hypothetical protein